MTAAFCIHLEYSRDILLASRVRCDFVNFRYTIRYHLTHEKESDSMCKEKYINYAQSGLLYRSHSHYSHDPVAPSSSEITSTHLKKILGTRRRHLWVPDF